MKTSLLLIAVCTVFGKPIFSQTYDSVDINDINALIASHGNHFWDGEDYAHYYVPRVVYPVMPKSSLFAHGLWIGGFDDSEELHVAAQTYRQSGGDFWPGPVANDYAAPGYAETYDDVWVVDKATIENHILNWNTGGYVVPASIADWPGNGNTANGEAEILAPFYDYNDNLLYDPEHGDYPIIRGDEAAFFMINDDADEHFESFGAPKMKIEIHGMAYAFDAPSDSALNQTLFMNYMIINRSAENYHDLYTGVFQDFDIGSFNDDWIGCDSNLNLFYGFNGDVTDGPGPEGYGVHPPAQGVVMLNLPMHMFKYFNNDFTMIGNPNATDDFYEYLTGYWQDGTPQTYGGYGYGGVTPCRFMYPSDIYDPEGWSERTAENTPSDKGGLGSSGPFTFAAGDSLCIDIAFVTAFSYDTLWIDAIPYTTLNFNANYILKERTQDIIDFYSSTFEDCGIIYQRNADFVEGVEQEILTGARIFPNPAREQITLQVNSKLFINGRVELWNALGERVLESEIDSDETKLNIYALDNGIYFLKILNNDTHVDTTPIIIQ